MEINISVKNRITVKRRSPFLMLILYVDERSSTMHIIDRLKMELSDQEYFSFEQNIQSILR